MRVFISTIVLSALAIAGLLAQTGLGTLNIYYIDTEGGQSTLFVSPSGESLLVDTGNAGERDLGRIVETLNAAGIKRIDHMWTTHYHGDHVGAMLALAKQFPMMHFYDHGKPHPADRIVSAAFLTSYEELSQGKRTIVKPGDKVKMTGLDITAVAHRSCRSCPPCGLRRSRMQPTTNCTTSRPSSRTAVATIHTGSWSRTVPSGTSRWIPDSRRATRSSSG